MNHINKILLISLFIGNMNASKEETQTKDPYRPQIEVIIPNQNKEPNGTVRFLQQVLRLTVAAGVVYAVNEDNARKFREFLEKHKGSVWDALEPGVEYLIRTVQTGEENLNDNNLVSKYGIKGAAAILAYLVTDLSWEDCKDFLKLPIYLINAAKVSSAMAFYYLAFLYYKQYLPDCKDLKPTTGNKNE